MLGEVFPGYPPFDNISDAHAFIVHCTHVVSPSVSTRCRSLFWYSCNTFLSLCVSSRSLKISRLRSSSSDPGARSSTDHSLGGGNVIGFFRVVKQIRLFIVPIHNGSLETLFCLMEKVFKLCNRDRSSGRLSILLPLRSRTSMVGTDNI